MINHTLDKWSTKVKDISLDTIFNKRISRKTLEMLNVKSTQTLEYYKNGIYQYSDIDITSEENYSLLKLISGFDAYNIYVSYWDMNEGIKEDKRLLVHDKLSFKQCRFACLRSKYRYYINECNILGFSVERKSDE